MSVKQIVKEAMDRNPINMKEALSEELRSRVARAIEERAEQLSEASFEVGDKVKHPYDGSGPTPVVGTVKEVRGSGKNLVVSVDFGEGTIDLMPNSGDRMDKLVKESLDKKEVIRVYNKIKDFSKDALKGYAKKIGMPRDAISPGSDTEELVDEIMSFLFDEDWLSVVMKSGSINESTVMVGGEEWEVIEKNRASIVIKSKRDGAKLSLHKGEKMFNAVSKQLEVNESLEEAVRVGYDRYKRSHGSKPGTQSGLWMFTNKSSGTPDYNDDEEVFEYNGSRKDAEKAAKEWAKSNGYRSVYVMEQNKGETTMSVKQIVKEAMDRNPINMKEALQEELKARVAEAVEKRINEASKDFKKGDYVSHVDDEKVGKVTGVSGDKESVDVKWNDGETGSYDAEDLKVVKEDLDEASNPTWEAKIGNKTYKVKAKNTFEANKKAQKMADKEGNAGSPNGKIKKVDESAGLEEAKSVDDFMKLFKLKDEPEEGKRMNLGGYPFDYDEFETDEVFLTAVDVDAAKGLVKEFKKRGFDASSSGQTVSISFE